MRVIERSTNLGELCQRDHLDGEMFNCDERGHTFVITGLENGTPKPFTGSVGGFFLPPDGGDAIAFTSEEAEIDAQGRAVVTLPDNCYSVIGQFRLTITNTVSGDTTTIYSATGFISEGTTDEVVQPGNVISVSTIQGMMSDMAAAESDCIAAAAFVPNYIADAYDDQDGVYAVGDCVTKDGALYRCVVPIDTAEVWTAAHWNRVYTGAEFEAVRDGIKSVAGAMGFVPYWVDGSASVSNPVGGVTVTSTVKQTGMDVTLNGASSSAGNYTRVCLSGALIGGDGASYIGNFPRTIQAVTGHTYRISIEKLGGTITLPEGGSTAHYVGAYIYDENSNNYKKRALLSGDNPVRNADTYTPTADVKICIALVYERSVTSFTDLRLRITLEDTTDTLIGTVRANAANIALLAQECGVTL